MNTTIKALVLFAAFAPLPACGCAVVVDDSTESPDAYADVVDHDSAADAASECIPPTACHLTAESYPGGPWCSVENLPNGYDCSNGAECNASACMVGECIYAPAPDGTPCAGGSCSSGACLK